MPETQRQNPPLLFNGKRLKQNRRRALQLGGAHHPLFTDLQHEIADRLAEINRSFVKIWVIGGLDDGLVQLLKAQNPERQIEFLSARDFPEDEFLPRHAHQFDLIISFMLLHHTNDVLGHLIQINQQLVADGFMLTICLGADTLIELRQSLTAIELEHKKGASPRTAPSIDMRDAGMLLQRARFALPATDRTRITLISKDFYSLIGELRQLGQGHGLMAMNKLYCGRDFFEALNLHYQKCFGTKTNEIPASFDVFFLAGWKESDTQQKPLKRGEGKIALADALATKGKA